MKGGNDCLPPAIDVVEPLLLGTEFPNWNSPTTDVPVFTSQMQRGGTPIEMSPRFIFNCPTYRPEGREALTMHILNYTHFSLSSFIRLSNLAEPCSFLAVDRVY